jgi:integral membrane sensor domain MASE1
MYKEGLPLRMINKDSSKHIQKEQISHRPHRAEYQTVRLFAILGILTIVFVLMIRLVQNGTIGSPQRLPTSLMDTTEATRK